MKTETKVKKLILKKETLQDLTARHAEEIKGGACGLTTGALSWYTCKGKGCNGKTKRCMK